jgi:uncharacterized damage-inducible protein DinB
MKKTKRPAARKTAKAAAKRKPVMRHGRDGVRARSKQAKPSAKRAAKPAATRSPASDMKRQYLETFSREFPTTLRVMKAYPPGKDDFKPHERSYAALRLVHTFSMENGVVYKAVRGELTMPPDLPPAPATFAEAVANYERGAKELMTAVERMPDSRFSEEVSFFTGPKQMGMVPVSQIMWLMLMDSIHHRGQLSVYIRMAGGKVPSIYGPSADEPWM